MNNPQSPPPEEVELDEILWGIVRPLAGTPCKTKDTHDFPDLKDGERCPVCKAYDNTEKAKQALLRWREAYADKARIEEAENARKYFTKPVIELDQRISALRKQQGDK